MLDLVPYSYALTYAPRQQPVPVPPWPGTDHPGPAAALRAARRRARRFGGSSGAWGNERPDRGGVRRSTEYDPAPGARSASFEVRFREVPHFITTYAVDIRSRDDSGRFTFSADCRPNDELVEFADGTDLLLVEATLPRPERTGVRGHLTPAEAGRARRAGGREARSCSPTSPTSSTRPGRASRARRRSGGPVEIAREGAVFEV